MRKISLDYLYNVIKPSLS